MYLVTSRMNPSSSLSPRLNAILNLVTQIQMQNPYPRIWDCCCDHGYLGIKILSESLCDKLIFVDQLTHIMVDLSNRLAPFDTGHHELITVDAGKLQFDINMSHLVILAGVGGERIVEIISEMESNHPDVQLDYILCPSTRQAALRQYLAEQMFGLVHETIVCEKKRCYEVMYVKGKASANELARVSLKSDLWDMNNLDHKRYLDKINKPRESRKSRSGNA